MDELREPLETVGAEPGSRFVKQQHPRPDHQLSAEFDELHVHRRQVLERHVAEVLQAEFGKKGVGSRIRLGQGRPPGAGARERGQQGFGFARGAGDR